MPGSRPGTGDLGGEGVSLPSGGDQAVLSDDDMPSTNGRYRIIEEGRGVRPAYRVLDPQPSKRGQGEDADAADDEDGQEDCQQSFRERHQGTGTHVSDGANDQGECR